MELVRKILGHQEDVHAFTCPLITKADGTKYGKSEKGNIFIDAQLTSVYEFYQFWIQNSDEDSIKLVKIFSLLPIPEIQSMIDAVTTNPNGLQRALAEEMTTRIHGEQGLAAAQRATNLLHGKGSLEDLKAMSPSEVAQIFEGVKQGTIARSELAQGINLLEFLASVGATTSKGDAKRKVTMDKCVSINTTKTVDENQAITLEDLIHDQLILINIGKKERFIVYAKD
jgi:tyrosyl-tRNA synthetase